MAGGGAEIADFGKKHLHEEGTIYMEIHEEIGEQVTNVFKSKSYSKIRNLTSALPLATSVVSVLTLFTNEAT